MSAFSRLVSVRFVPVLLVAAATLAACGGAAKDSSKAPDPFSPPVLAEATLSTTDPIPPPTGPVVLTLKDSPRANAGNDLVLDLAQLESMGTVSYAVDDTDATGHESVFSGPLLSTVLDYAGLEGRKIHIVALNDYVIDIPSSQFSQYPIMLATRMKGKTMSITDYGPTRVVYPNVDMEVPTELAPLWIWQVKEISVP